MHILIIGAAGMLGRKLTDALLQRGHLRGGDIGRLTLVDVVEPSPVPAWPDGVSFIRADLSQPGAAMRLVEDEPDVIFHMAAIVSADAEANFETGYRVNLDGTRALFEAIRLKRGDGPYRPRLVFTSSIVVFGEPFPETIPDTFFTTPLNSYGTQKAIGELLLADYSRRGFFDGVGIRLPTITIRPGKPNKAASGFFSSILREPLIGREALLPVSESVRHWFASPRSAIRFILRAAEIDTAAMGARRSLTMPGLSATVGEEIEALRRVAGQSAVDLIRREPDPVIANIIKGWPQRFDASRAEALGFEAETSFDEIIRIHIEDELEGGAHMASFQRQLD